MRLLRGILDLLYPPKCVFCRKIVPDSEKLLCPDCRGKYFRPQQRSGTFFLSCTTVLPYTGAVREAFLRYKFEDEPEYAGTFGELLADGLRDMGPYDLITWVPVSPKRKRQRGYDQAELLAKATAKALCREAVSTLKKCRDNPAQSGQTDAKARARNVRGVYELEPVELSGKTVLLIDDILTTGATMDEAAKNLLRGGAGAVYGAALACPTEQT